MRGKKRNFPTKQTAKDELPLRGFLICQKCGGKLTGSKSKGRDNYYFYYHCNQVCGERIKAPEANAIITGDIKKIAQFPIQYNSLFDSESLDLFGNGNKESIREKEKAQQDLLKHKERLHNAQQLLLDGGLDAADYKEIKARYEPIIRNLEDQLEVTLEATSEIKQYLLFGSYFFQNLNSLYFDGDLTIRQQIIGSFYPEKITFENYKPRTTRLNSVLSLICTPVAGSRDSKNRKIRKNADLSVKAPPARLERATL